MIKLLDFMKDDVISVSEGLVVCPAKKKVARRDGAFFIKKEIDDYLLLHFALNDKYTLDEKGGGQSCKHKDVNILGKKELSELYLIPYSYINNVYHRQYGKHEVGGKGFLPPLKYYSPSGVIAGTLVFDGITEPNALWNDKIERMVVERDKDDDPDNEDRVVIIADAKPSEELKFKATGAKKFLVIDKKKAIEERLNKTDEVLQMTIDSISIALKTQKELLKEKSAVLEQYANTISKNFPLLTENLRLLNQKFHEEISKPQSDDRVILNYALSIEKVLKACKSVGNSPVYITNDLQVLKDGAVYLEQSRVQILKEKETYEVANKDVALFPNELQGV